MDKEYHITRVWGKADTFDIEFEYAGGTRWTCRVPPDTQDGQYAVEIWAINEFKETAYWTGELYMCGGVCHLELHESPYLIWIEPQEIAIDIIKSKLNYVIEISKGCYCAKN